MAIFFVASPLLWLWLDRAELFGQAVGRFFKAAAVRPNPGFRRASDVEALGLESQCEGVRCHGSFGRSHSTAQNYHDNGHPHTDFQGPELLRRLRAGSRDLVVRRLL